jgi:hypothetical protein
MASQCFIIFGMPSIIEPPGKGSFNPPAALNPLNSWTVSLPAFKPHWVGFLPQALSPSPEYWPSTQRLRKRFTPTTR